MKLMALSALVVKAYPLVTVPLFLYFFTKEEFGSLDYAYYAMSLGCVLLTFGINNGYARYALDSTIDDDLKAKKFSYYLFSSVLIAAISVISLLIIKLLWFNLQQWIPTILLAYPSLLVFYIVSGALAHTVLTAERFSLNAKSLIIATLIIYMLPLFAVVIAYIALENISIYIVLIFNVIFNVFSFVVGFCRAYTRINANQIFKLCRRYIIFSTPLLFVLVSEALINLSGRLFLTKLYPSGLGDFAIASRVASVLLIFNFIISFMFHPIYFRDKDKASFVSFWRSLYSLFFIVYCFAIIIIPIVINLSLPHFDNLHNSKIIFSIILMLGANLLTGLQMFHLGMHAKEKSAVIGLIYSVGVLIAFFLNLILINRFQLVGAGLALFTTMLLITAPYIYYSNKVSENKLKTNCYAKISIAIALAYVLLYIRGEGSVNAIPVVIFLLLIVVTFTTAIKSSLRFYNEANSKF